MKTKALRSVLKNSVIFSIHFFFTHKRLLFSYLKTLLTRNNSLCKWPGELKLLELNKRHETKTEEPHRHSRDLMGRFVPNHCMAGSNAKSLFNVLQEVCRWIGIEDSALGFRSLGN